MDALGGATLARLEKNLLLPLPGERAQAAMTPVRRRLEKVERSDWKKAAVLLLLFPADGGLALPLTMRRDDLPVHAGQISLPGGSIEEGEGPEEAALREAFEEIGLLREAVRVLGRMSSLRIAPTGFEVIPILAFVPERPLYILEEREVAEIIELPLSRLLESDARRSEEWSIHGGPSLVPFWQVGTHKVWGATAMILAELAWLLDPITPIQS
ncbi:MAG: CoA pyrophosphatase [Spirochaetota bacterium]